MDVVDCVVVGGGIIGLAAARRLAMSGLETIVLEAAGAIGTETSARNSQVIHAGLYYPAGSLKARTCLEGREALYQYCRDRCVPHRKIGKLLVATEDAQLPALAAVRDQARRNDVHLVALDAREAATIEPALHCSAALLSPSTGIVDTHALMLSYRSDAEAAGAIVVVETSVTGGRIDGHRLVLETGGRDRFEIAARRVVNAAGLDAPGLARRIRGLPPEFIPRSYLAKGNYFGLRGVAAPFDHLIYPLPDRAGLGIHLTLDLSGRARFGPDVEWTQARNYDVDPGRAAAFYDAIRRYWPDLPNNSLIADYAGIRPKISGPNAPAADFRVQGPDIHGVPGLVNLFGIESPGITASLALAALVAEKLGVAALAG